MNRNNKIIHVVAFKCQELHFYFSDYGKYDALLIIMIYSIFKVKYNCLSVGVYITVVIIIIIIIIILR